MRNLFRDGLLQLGSKIFTFFYSFLCIKFLSTEQLGISAFMLNVVFFCSVFWDGSLVNYILIGLDDRKKKVIDVLSFRLTILFIILFVSILMRFFYFFNLSLFLAILLINFLNLDFIFKALGRYHLSLIYSMIIYLGSIVSMFLIDAENLMTGSDYYIVLQFTLLIFLVQILHIHRNYINLKNVKFFMVSHVKNFYIEKRIFFLQSALSIIQITSPILIFGFLIKSDLQIGIYRESLFFIAPLEIVNTTLLIFVQQNIGSNRIIDIVGELKKYYMLILLAFVLCYFLVPMDFVLSTLNVSKNVELGYVIPLILLRGLNTISTFDQLVLINKGFINVVSTIVVFSLVTSTILLGVIHISGFSLPLLLILAFFEVPYFILIKNNKLCQKIFFF